MNLKDHHTTDKPVSTAAVFKSDNTTAISLQILAGEKLKEHKTPVESLLLCVSGKAIYGEDGGKTVTLTPGDYVQIPATVIHWVEGVETSQLILVK